VLVGESKFELELRLQVQELERAEQETVVVHANDSRATSNNSALLTMNSDVDEMS